MMELRDMTAWTERCWHAFQYEALHQLRRPTTWTYGGGLAALAAGAAFAVHEEALQNPAMLVNSPYGIAFAALLVSVFGLLVTAGVAGDAAGRDVRTRLHPLLYTTPLPPSCYLAGRFSAVLVVNAGLLGITVVVLALATGPLVVDAELLGPSRPAALLQAYALILFPNLFVSGAVAFAAAALGRRAMAAFGGAIALFLVTVVAVTAAETGVLAPLAPALDPLGLVAFMTDTAAWTPVERNVRLLPLDGALGLNRLLWVGLAVGVLAVAVARFRFAHAGVRDRSRALEPLAVRTQPISVAVPDVPRGFGPGTRLRQTLALASSTARALVINRTFALVATSVVLAFVILGAELEDRFGTAVLPTTATLGATLGGVLASLVMAVLVAVYAGEVVWRERDAGLDLVLDAAPVPDGVRLAGVMLGLGAVLVVLQGVLATSAVGFQALHGVEHVEPLRAAGMLFALPLADYALMAVLAVFVHVLVGYKALGHLVVGTFLAVTLLLGAFRPVHTLWLYAGDPGLRFSDLSGFGGRLGPYFWFKLYWAAWAVLFALGARLLWGRGTEQGARSRLRLARRRLSGRMARAVAGAAALVLVLGGFVFAQTSVVHEHRTADEQAALAARYERRYGQFEGAAQPEMVAVRLWAELYPGRRRADVRGLYRLVNGSAAPIDTVHLSLEPDVETTGVSFDRAAEAVVIDEPLGHRSYRLAEPLTPGDTLVLRFTTRYAPDGFPPRGLNTSVAAGGTYLSYSGGRSMGGRSWLPVVGYVAARELKDPRRRREHGLGPHVLAPPPDDPAAPFNTFGRESIWFEATIGTPLDEIGVAPGVLRETWAEGERRYVRYATERPIRNAFGLFSGRYHVRRDTWRDPASERTVEVEIFHHPGHTRNLGRMARAAKATLAYLTEHAGPYPHGHLRLVEVPADAGHARAFPGTIAIAEDMGFLADVGEGDVDTPAFVVAHEVAHQWWGHQLMPAHAEGAPLLTEVLSQYAALMVMETLDGPAPVAQFLRQMRIEYGNRWASQSTPEVPLLQTTNDPQVAYRKGAVVMYALREALGEDRVNAALRRLLARFGDAGPPYPTSLDLYRELQAVAPADQQDLLADLFEANTLWDVRAVAARAEPAANGWRVHFDVEVHQYRADSLGREHEVPMAMPVEIGIYAPGAGPHDEPIALLRQPLRTGAQTVTVTVAERPGVIAIDPRGLLIERLPDDNAAEVTLASAAADAPPP